MPPDLDLTPDDDRPRDVLDPAAGKALPLEPGGRLEAHPGPLEAPGPPPELTEAEVAAALENLGDLAGWLIPGPDAMPDLWRPSPDEVDALAPPLTRVLNKRLPAARRAITATDELAVAAAVGRYTLRRVATLRQLEDTAEAAQLEPAPDVIGVEPAAGGGDREPWPNVAP